MSLSFYHRVASRILSCHARDLPDLRRATVLLPNYHAAQPLAQALSAAANLPALLLPQMVTLNDWAQSIPLETFIQPDTQRIAALYQALRERRWFADADLWGLSRELLELMNELTRHHVALPESEAEFAEQLAEAYQARSGQAMQFEARVVHELWYAMAASGDLDGVRAYQQRLAQLAQQVDTPLYVLQTADLSAPEAHFLEACRAQVPVTIFDLREMVAAAPDCALLSRALQRGADSADLRSDAALLKELPEAAMKNRLKLFAAHGLEQEAQAADVQIRQWLLAGKQSIAVVVQDRLVARRVRALLERAQVQVRDETGWTFATMSVSTVLMRWLEAVQNDFYYQDVLDLFKSPFLFADAAPGERKQAAYLFEQMVRKHGMVAHLQGFLEVAERETPELIQPLARLRQAAQALPKKSVPLADWLRALHDSLDILGVAQGWAQDAAGQQLLGLLAQWTEELHEDATRCSFGEWRRWLSQQLDLNTFRDTAVDSPVLFTHLAATRWRSFDAVLLVGCDAAHLPAPANAGQWFNDAVRAALGLPLSNAQQLQVRDDMLALLAMNDTVLATWQASQNGEPNLLSPHLEMLRALHLLAYGDDLADTGLAALALAAQVRGEAFALPPAGEMPQPAAPSALLPQRISPSGYNSLVACPYQFYARHILHLNELDEVREELDKRDYGTWVHAVLQRFHAEYPLLMNHACELLAAELQRISAEVFADALAHDYLAQAWLLRWQALIPAYLDWQLENEQAGWRYHAAEKPFELAVDGELTLRGRLDRIDRRADAPEKLCVLDYKTQHVARLKGKLQDAGEDVQLSCYALVSNAGAAAFVSLEGEKVIAVAPPQDIAELAQLDITRLRTVFGQMREGAALPAHGAETVCGYCEMNGLCRRGEWEAEHG
ncbi:MAG TPA: PD-(D/E)XK nuclease family protein [Gallionella sp.]|nr:PD-(D/E)XK nuclease family protein [Gallionella sp.]